MWLSVAKSQAEENSAKILNFFVIVMGKFFS
jgi:hypothetical protein